MSRTVDINFTFQSSVTVSSVVGSLSQSGWSPTEPLGISYAREDEDGDLEWESAAPDSSNQVITILDSPQNQGHVVGISIYHQETETGGLLLFFADRTQVSFSPSINRRKLAVAEEMTDLPWYLERMLPGLYATGILGYQAQDIAD
ncbi:hypothetical protein ACH4U6_09185 [Streptomyces netropsis]|uniref:hypothetical protein n=1 Tax=Streptomyces netropsis TaxID=55404 RepID=UPI003791E87D